MSRNVRFGFLIELFDALFGLDHLFFDVLFGDVWSVLDRRLFDHVSLSTLGFGFMCGHIVCDICRMDFGLIVDLSKKRLAFLCQLIFVDGDGLFALCDLIFEVSVWGFNNLVFGLWRAVCNRVTRGQNQSALVGAGLHAAFDLAFCDPRQHFSIRGWGLCTEITVVRSQIPEIFRNRFHGVEVVFETL